MQAGVYCQRYFSNNDLDNEDKRCTEEVARDCCLQWYHMECVVCNPANIDSNSNFHCDCQITDLWDSTLGTTRNVIARLLTCGTVHYKAFLAGVRLVAILKKISPAVLQTYNLPLDGAVYNYFQSFQDLLQVCVFPFDTVVDTTLHVQIAIEIACKEFIVIAQDKDLGVYKEELSAATNLEHIGLGATQHAL
ncbi:hypothetical protein ACROYT_G014371 [Oculina patagonica]